MLRIFKILLLTISVLHILSACREDTELIIPVHKATHHMFKDFKDFKKCVSESGDTFTARHYADTFFVSGEAVDRQVPVYQVVSHQLKISDLQVHIEFEAIARYDSVNIIRTYDEFVMRIIHGGIVNELVLSQLPKELVCVKNCIYNDTIHLHGQIYTSVLAMKNPTIPTILYSLLNEGKLIGFKSADGHQYRWLD